MTPQQLTCLPNILYHALYRAIGGWKGAFIINGVIFVTILVAGLLQTLP